MTQTAPQVVFPPLLLATDGSPSARLAQRLICSIAHLFRGEDPPPDPASPRSLVTVMTVQPKVANRSRPFSKKAALPTQEATQIEAIAAIATAVATEEQAKEQLEERSQEQKAGQPEGRVESPSASTLSSIDSLSALVEPDFDAANLSLQVRQGRPATEILNCARTIQAGLIAVGHRGAGGVRELLLGSVSTAIARYAPCSVLIARTNIAHTNANAIADPSLTHVLLIVDGSSAAKQAIAATRQLIPAGIQRVTLLHIQSPLNASYLVGPFVSPTPSWQLDQSLQSAQREQGEQLLQRAKTTLDRPDLEVQTRLQKGDLGPAICQVAQELQVNLVILGSDATRRSLLSPLQAVRLPGRGTNPAANPNPSTKVRPILRNTRLSITEDYVIHYAPCSVLLCRAMQPVK